MDVIRHDRHDIQRIFSIVIVDAAVKRNLSSQRRKCPPLKCAKRDEVRLEIALQVRQISAIETATNHSRHRLDCVAL